MAKFTAGVNDLHHWDNLLAHTRPTNLFHINLAEHAWLRGLFGGLGVVVWGVFARFNSTGPYALVGPELGAVFGVLHVVYAVLPELTGYLSTSLERTEVEENVRYNGGFYLFAGLPLIPLGWGHLKESGFDVVRPIGFVIFFFLIYILPQLFGKRPYRSPYLTIDEKRIKAKLDPHTEATELRWDDIEAVQIRLISAHFKTKEGEDIEIPLNAFGYEKCREAKTVLEKNARVKDIEIR